MDNGFLIAYSLTKLNEEQMLQGIYVITDNRYFSYSNWPDRVEDIILGGASVIQVRDKQLSDDDLFAHAAAIQEVCRFYNVLFIMNDRVSLAKKLNADGVHIGRDDQKIRMARQYLGNKFFIGASCYRNLFTAVQAQRQGADYVAFGSIFPSATKPSAPRCALATLREAKNILRLPVCAIGGINKNNIRSVFATGVEMVAISHAIFNAKNPQQAATKLIQPYIM